MDFVNTVSHTEGTEMREAEGEKEVPKLMTIPEIARHRGLSRQLVHRIAQSDPAFPAPTTERGTTRLKYPTEAVDAFFNNRVIRPGRRTDLERKRGRDHGEGPDS